MIITIHKIRITAKRFLIILLVFSSLIPDIGIKFSTMGFYWTFYRISVPLGLFIYLLMPRQGVSIVRRAAYRKWILLVAFWLIYGAVLMVLSPYRDFHKGCLELLSIFNGLICMYILISVIRNKNDVDQILNTVYFVYILLVFIGLLEIATEHHLPMSVFNDRTAENLRNSKAATGIFYAENDFSAFLTCFMPIVLVKKRHVVFNSFAILGTVYIDHINDANICILALIVAVGYYFTFIKQYGRHGQAVLRSILITIAIIIVLYIWANIDALASRSTLLNVIRTQQKNISNSQGSLFARLTISSDSLKASLSSAFLGIGPASFTNYFLLHPSKSELVNPHNLYLEILVEYGLIIAGSFIIFLIQMIKTLRRKLQQCKDNNAKRKLIAGCEMVVLYCMVCVASSSFLGYAWQWVVISIGIILMGIPETELADTEFCHYVTFHQSSLLSENNAQ